jgi:dUTP pyrophosphatase
VTDTPLLKVRLLYPDSILPERATHGSSGLDLYAWIPDESNKGLTGPRRVTLRAGQRALVCTGIELEIPEGFEGQIRSRSGLAWNDGLVVLNSPGTIDSDYRGEVKVILMNMGTDAVTIPHGYRFAQLVIAAVAVPRVCCVHHALSHTSRGYGGIGSTGS